MYVRKFDDKVHSFGVSGKLWRDSLVMYDRETHSYWSHVTGKALKGKYEGKQLKALPVQHLKWKEWKKAYPDSKILVKSRFTTRSSYDRYNRSRKRLGIFGTVNFDKRLDGKDVVFGLVIDDLPIVFPHKYFTNTNLVNYSIENQNILAVYSKDAETVTVFNRLVDDRVLTFESAESIDTHYLRDRETGTLWDGLTGKGLKGELKGKKLKQLVGTQAFWFGWRGFYPRTIIWNPSG